MNFKFNSHTGGVKYCVRLREVYVKTIHFFLAWGLNIWWGENRLWGVEYYFKAMIDFKALKKSKNFKIRKPGSKIWIKATIDFEASKSGYMLTRGGNRSNLQNRNLWKRIKILRLSISLFQNQPLKPISQKQPRRTAVCRRVRKIKKIIFSQRINLAFRIMNLFTNVRSEAAEKLFLN